MPQITSGQITSGPNAGKLWAAYPDPASPTGWTVKTWHQYDVSNGGRPNESFEPFNAGAADQWERQTQQQQAGQAAQAAQQGAQQRFSTQADTDAYNSALRYRDVRTGVADTQWDKNYQQGVTTERDRVQQAKDALAEQQRQYNLTYGLDVRGQNRADAAQGADLLKFGATLRGPANAFQGFQFAQGVANDPSLTNYVNSIYGGNGPAYGGGTAAGGSPAPLTIGSLIKSMGGSNVPGAGAQGAAQPGGTGTDAYGRPNLTAEQQSYLAPIKSAYEGGLANKGLGYLENQTPGQLAALHSGGD